MSRHSNQEIITSIQNGDEDILLYLSKKYFQQSRNWLRRKGCKDADTPSIFSTVLVRVVRELQHNRISPNIDFELFFFNSLGDYFSDDGKPKQEDPDAGFEKENSIINSCFTILDEYNKKILSLRYCEKLSFEQIAARMDFSNPVIAQFEFNKAFVQYENVVRARLNVAMN